MAASTFAIPQVSNDISKEPPSPRAEEYVLYDGKALRPIDVSALKGNPERGGRAYTIDSTGHLSPDPSTFTAPKPDDPNDPPPPQRVVIVFADRTTPAVPLLDLLAKTYPDRCWGLAVATAEGSVTTIAPAQCPPSRPSGKETDEMVQLAAYRSADKISVGISRVNDIAEVELGKLGDALHQDKASAFFADRTDAAIAVHDAATIADAVDLLAAAHIAGFVDARWIPAKYLPVKLGGATGTEPEPPPTAAPTDD